MTRPNLFPTANQPQRLAVTETTGTAESTLNYFRSCARVTEKGFLRTEDDRKRLVNLPLMWPQALRFSANYTLEQLLTILEGTLNLVSCLRQPTNGYQSYSFKQTSVLNDAKAILLSEQKGLGYFCGIVMPMLDQATPQHLADLSKQLLRLADLELSLQDNNYTTLVQTMCGKLQTLADQRQGEKQQSILRRIAALQATLPSAPSRPLPKERADAPNGAPAQ